MFARPPDESAASDRRIRLSTEWDELVRRTRDLPGFHDFLKPSRPDLARATSGGPVVVPLVTDQQAHALLLTSDGLRSVPLQHVTEGDCRHYAMNYHSAFRELAAASAGYLSDLATAQATGTPTAIRTQMRSAERRLAAVTNLDEVVRTTQEWMWDASPAEILAELDLLSNADPLPRLWWCPTGHLSLLPLHAAGYHRRAPLEGAGRRETVLDRVCSSYTPTVRALTDARLGQDPQRGSGEAPGRMLVVAVADAPGFPTLGAVEREVAAIERQIPHENCTTIRGSAARRDSVLDALERHSWVHFGCHGDQDLDSPSAGGVLLQDGILTISDIASRRCTAEFAALSACKTGLGGEGLRNESMTLAAALHYIGFRHVVATISDVESETAADVFEMLYHQIAPTGEVATDRVASALNSSLRAVRDRFPDEPRRWTPFIHIGP